MVFPPDLFFFCSLSFSFLSFVIRFSSQFFWHISISSITPSAVCPICTRSLATARDRRSEKECPFPSGVAQADAEGSAAAAAAAVVSFGRPGIPQHHLEGQGDGLRPPARPSVKGEGAARRGGLSSPFLSVFSPAASSAPRASGFPFFFFLFFVFLRYFSLV